MLNDGGRGFDMYYHQWKLQKLSGILTILCVTLQYTQNYNTQCCNFFKNKTERKKWFDKKKEDSQADSQKTVLWIQTIAETGKILTLSRHPRWHTTWKELKNVGI